MNVDVSDVCCVNSQCVECGKRGAGNLLCRKLVGRDRLRYLRCRTCRQEFSERKGTALHGVKIPQAKALSVLEHLGDGCGIRQTARLSRASQGAVLRLSKRVGRHAQRTHDELARHLQVREVQLDERWSFVQKKARPLRSR